MKLSELKGVVREIVLNERSINAISKLQQKNADNTFKTLELYKKVKMTLRVVLIKNPSSY